MNEPLPTRDEINVFDTLDERTAIENFLGKSLADAQAMFHENFLYYQEDLMFMGAVAFRYYVRAAIAYLLDRDAKPSCDEVSVFLTDVEHRVEWADTRDDVSASFPTICEGLERMLAQWDAYGCDSAVIVDIYGDVRRRCESLLERLRKFSN